MGRMSKQREANSPKGIRLSLLVYAGPLRLRDCVLVQGVVRPAVVWITCRECL